MALQHEFVVPSFTHVPRGYSPEHKIRINQDPTAMFEIMQSEGALIGSRPLTPDLNLWAAVAGSPYCNPQEAGSAHFLVFAHNHEDPQYYNLQNLDPAHVAKMADIAYGFLAADPDRRGAGFNIGPQNEPNVESSQGWKNIHLQCFTMPDPESRTLVESVTDEAILSFIEKKRSSRAHRLEPVAQHMARQTRDTLPQARIYTPEELPNQWTLHVPSETDNLTVAQYLIQVDEYLNTMHAYHLAHTHADVVGARPTKPIYTIGLGVTGCEKFVRITLQDDVGGSKMGIAETAFGMWSLRAANSQGQSFEVDDRYRTTDVAMQQFRERTIALGTQILVDFS